MKKLIVKGISHQEKYISTPTARIDAIESDSISSGYEALSATPKIFSSIGAPSLNLSRTIEIKLSVEELIPNTNFMNIWIGNQLMTGTMIDEITQTIKGYIERTPLTQDKVFLEYPDGEKREFAVPVVESSTE